MDASHFETLREVHSTDLLTNVTDTRSMEFGLGQTSCQGTIADEDRIHHSTTYRTGGELKATGQRLASVKRQRAESSPPVALWINSQTLSLTWRNDFYLRSSFIGLYCFFKFLCIAFSWRHRLLLCPKTFMQPLTLHGYRTPVLSSAAEASR
jgi:hypothetical protein